MRTLTRRDWLRLSTLAAGSVAAARLFGQTLPFAPPPERLINLGGNENPLGPSPAVLRAILQAAPFSARYPFREEERLREAVASHEQVDLPSIVLGQGCDDVLALAAHACLDRGQTLICSSPTYFQLPDYARKLGVNVIEVPCDPTTFRHDLPALARACRDHRARLVYVCNPDNPTGTECPAEALSAFCREQAQAGVTVVVDEVYLDFAETSSAKSQVALVREGLPLVVTRSFSKVHGLAGHRIGYAVTTPTLAEGLARWQRSGLNFIGVAAARAALGDSLFVAQCRAKIAATRSRYTTLLEELGLAYIPSVGNFVFHEVRRPMADYQAAMKARGFYVGWPHPAHPAFPTWCRTSLGTDQEMEQLAGAMRAELQTLRGV